MYIVDVLDPEAKDIVKIFDYSRINVIFSSLHLAVQLYNSQQ